VFNNFLKTKISNLSKNVATKFGNLF